MTKFGSYIKRHRYVLILIILPLFVFWRNLIPIKDRVFFGNDSLLSFYTLYSITSQIKQGLIPLWDPHTFFGIPLITRADSLVFYPPLGIFVLLSAFFNISLTNMFVLMEFITILHLSLAGVSMYFLLKRFKLSNFACFIGGIIYMFNGNIIAHMNTTGLVISMTFLPLAFLAFDWLIHQPTLKRILTFALILGMQIITFSWQNVLVYQSLFLFIYFCYRAFTREINIKKALIASFLALVIALLCAAVVLIPGLAVPYISDRADLVYKLSAYSVNLKPRQLIELVMPYFFSQGYGENGDLYFPYGYVVGYAGILPLLLIIPAFFKKNKDTLFFTLMMVVILLFSLGGETPVFDISYATLYPVMSVFRNIIKVIYISFFCLSIVAAFGVENIIRFHNQLLTRINAYKNLLLKLLLGFIIVALLFLLNARKDLLYAKNTPAYLGISSEIASICISLMIFFFSVLTFYAINNKIKFYKTAVSAVLIFDLFIFAKTYPVNNGGIDPSKLIANNAVVTFIASHAKAFYQRSDITEFPQSYAPGVWRINHIDGYLVYRSKILKSFLLLKSHPERNYLFDRLANIAYIATVSEIKDSHYTLAYRKIIGEEDQNIYYQRGATNSGWEPMPKGSIVKVYQTDYLPQFAYFADKSILVDDSQAQQIIKEAKNFDPSRDAIIYDPSTSGRKEEGSYQTKLVKSKQRFTVDYSKPYEAQLQVTSPVPTVFATSLPFYDDWKAQVDDKFQNILRVNIGFIGVAVPPGNHKVKIFYDPSLFRLGLLISAFSVLAIVIVLCFLKPKEV